MHWWISINQSQGQNEHFCFWYFKYILLLMLLNFWFSRILNAGLLLVLEEFYIVNCKIVLSKGSEYFFHHWLQYIHMKLWEWPSVCVNLKYFYLLVFQIWMVSSSTLLCFSACSSRKSKKYLTAGGTTATEHSTLRKKSSTNCCSVPWKGPQIMWDRAEAESRARNIKALRHSYLHTTWV